MEFTPKQRKIFEKFDEKCGDLVPEKYDHEFHLGKWLIARRFNIDKAETMLRKHLAWRKEFGVDDILRWQPPEGLVKYNPVGNIGNDVEGSPVWLLPFGRIDLKGIIHSWSKMDYVRVTIRNIWECLLEMSTRLSPAGKPIRTWTVIIDLEGFSLFQFAYKPVLDILIELMKAYGENLPEVLKHAFLINAPSVFTITYNALRPFIDEETMEKIQIYGTSGWLEPVLKEIPAEILPKHWGGKAVDPDGDTKCRSKIVMGGPIPKSYYMKNRRKAEGKSTDKYKKITVPEGSKEMLTFDIKDPGTWLCWDVQSEDYDIGFGVHRETESGSESLIPLTRVNCHLVPEEGTLLCMETGKYVLTFDNEFSYIRSKDIIYNVYMETSSDDVTKM